MKFRSKLRKKILEEVRRDNGQSDWWSDRYMDSSLSAAEKDHAWKKVSDISSLILQKRAECFRYRMTRQYLFKIEEIKVESNPNSKYYTSGPVDVMR